MKQSVTNTLTKMTKRLNEADIATARLDSLLLLEAVTSKDRSWLLANPEYELNKQQLDVLDAYLRRRANHEPLAYIRGKSEFYGRKFTVNSHTLEPRPETEMMIELLKHVMEDRRWKIEDGVTVIDVGTGSGCIAITAKLELPKVDVYATDIDEKCIETAQKNATDLKADVCFYKGNLLQPILNDKWKMINGKCVVLANLPYVPESYQINKAAQHEPKRAIYGGEDGLDLYGQMFEQVESLPNRPLSIFTESLPFQHNTLTEVAARHGYILEKAEDFIQVFSTSNTP